MSDYDDEFENEVNEAEETPKDVVLPDGITVSVTLKSDQWISGSMNDSILKGVIQSLTGTIKKSIKKTVEEKIIELANTEFETLAQKYMEDYFSRSHKKTNSWGDKTGEEYTVRELLQDRFIKYLDEKVDAKSGGSSSYSGSITRQQFMINELAHKPLTEAVNQTVTSIANVAKGQIQESVSRYIAEKLTPTISAPALIAPVSK